MPKRKLIAPATKPGFVIVEAVDSADGGLCLVVNNTRIAGCEPSLGANNVRYRWNVREEYLRRAMGVPDDVALLCPVCKHPQHAGRTCSRSVPNEEHPLDSNLACGCEWSSTV
jgi:hypothetical protein